MEKKLHLLESFAARDSGGSTYRVRAYEHLARDESVAGDERWEPTGQIEYRLDTGERVHEEPDGSLRIDGSGVQLTVRQATRSDALAPAPGS